MNTVADLAAAKESDRVSLPAFDKASDDCVAIDLWPSIEGPVDVIILEGWFMGAKPQTDSELSSPLNELESFEDRDAVWRRYVNDQLGQGYQQLFSRLQLLIVLQAPNFEPATAPAPLVRSLRRLRRVRSSGVLTRRSPA